MNLNHARKVISKSAVLVVAEVVVIRKAAATAAAEEAETAVAVVAMVAAETETVAVAVDTTGIINTISYSQLFQILPVTEGFFYSIPESCFIEMVRIRIIQDPVFHQ